MNEDRDVRKKGKKIKGFVLRLVRFETGDEIEILDGESNAIWIKSPLKREDFKREDDFLNAVYATGRVQDQVEKYSLLKVKVLGDRRQTSK